MSKFRNSAAERPSSFGFFLFFCLIFSFLSFCPTAWSANYVVTTPSDSDADPGVSLREAIINANTNPGPDTITFNIPDIFTKIITPTSPLPALTDNDTTIDGYTQSGASPATAGSPAVLQVMINGISTAASVGLNITSSGNTIKGLIINNFDLHGMAITGVGATGNVISGNYIGTDSTGNADQGNGGNGIYIASGASGNVIGGSSPADRNIISGNNQSGILITGTGTDTNTVSGNYIGINAGGGASLPNSLEGIRISGGAEHNRVGGNTVAERNVVSGNAQAGIRLEGAETNSNVILGNYIGLASSGTGGVGGQDYGIYLLSGANHNVIGGGSPGERNVISGNGDQGIYLNGAHFNFISGNFIGTDPSGMTARGNFNGILLTGSNNNVIGGDTPGTGNVLSGNVVGIGLSSDANTTRGNIVGLAVDGVTPLPNVVGINILSSNNIIGGSLPVHRNIVSGNTDEGIFIGGGFGHPAENNVVSGNYIGTDVTGSVAVGNNLGISLASTATNNVIGGDTPGSENVVSGNQWGIRFVGVAGNIIGNNIKGNLIGTDPSGLNPIGNLHNGVHFGVNTQGNFVGPHNTIAFNGEDGVGVDSPTAQSNFITRNRIFANGGMGINLTNAANGDIPAPAIQSTTFGSIRIAVLACPGCAVQVFNSRFPDGEGEFYLGGGVADAAGAYTLVVDSLAYPYLTATATDVRGTSEFSPIFTSTAYPLHLPVILR